ncbi:MAG: WYL domain-containing protein [Phaeovulum sp.]|uniref:helix-turn-helix transcriptional regulator n=1 Tax=Phaeovulum sp. TaxID=2934796 RepID=UPI002733B7DD|nr:WYL domain-containing protein [Phaeovulum sp.]MDP3860087.1 WYL domain-containing protein [Phaeovulum sp.]
MPRADRLFRHLSALRSLPAPVTAALLAEETGVSPRTLYRDIASLRAGGALVDGAAGFGYRLTEDPALPPQSFTRLELEALVTGLGEVRQSGDAALAKAAQAAQAKIIATLPERLQRQALHAVTQVYRAQRRPPPPVDPDLLREAAWEERALDLSYADADGSITTRRIYPLSIVVLDRTEMLLAWCCLRQDFRAFLLERMRAVAASDESFRPRRVPLLRERLRRLGGS